MLTNNLRKIASHIFFFLFMKLNLRLFYILTNIHYISYLLCFCKWSYTIPFSYTGFLIPIPMMKIKYENEYDELVFIHFWYVFITMFGPALCNLIRWKELRLKVKKASFRGYLYERVHSSIYSCIRPMG